MHTIPRGNLSEKEYNSILKKTAKNALFNASIFANECIREAQNKKRAEKAQPVFVPLETLAKYKKYALLLSMIQSLGKRDGVKSVEREDQGKRGHGVRVLTTKSLFIRIYQKELTNPATIQKILLKYL